MIKLGCLTSIIVTIITIMIRFSYIYSINLIIYLACMHTHIYITVMQLYVHTASDGIHSPLSVSLSDFIVCQDFDEGDERKDGTKFLHNFPHLDEMQRLKVMGKVSDRLREDECGERSY